MDVIGYQDLRPEFQSASLDEVSSLVLEHRVLVGDIDQFFVTEPSSIGDVGQVRIPLLAVFPNDERIVNLRGARDIQD